MRVADFSTIESTPPLVSWRLDVEMQVICNSIAVNAIGADYDQDMT